MAEHVDAGNLAEELAGGVGRALQRIEDHIHGVADAELQAVAALELLALHSFPVDEGSVLAPLVDDVELSIFRNNQGMITRNPGIGNGQVLIGFASDCEGTAVQIDLALGAVLHEHQHGKYARSRFRARSRDG